MPLCEQCSRRESKAMRALESLTPSGSEFVDEVERCVQFVRDNRESLMRVIVQLKERLNKLEDNESRRRFPDTTGS